ncbi:hypothetical protein Prudu_009277 [Prunus dulcis]|uniref:Uncharacterized protein n=1 Tax=Prunus dulcis TaxID=3755 RepID=A0A4Y1R609_PRUDU|nr:hypothetical protein Prudu_009277 [Prunus dulcis]
MALPKREMVKTSEASEARAEESDDGVVSTGEAELRFPTHRINDLPESATACRVCILQNVPNSKMN